MMTALSAAKRFKVLCKQYGPRLPHREQGTAHQHKVARSGRIAGSCKACRDIPRIMGRYPPAAAKLCKLRRRQRSRQGRRNGKQLVGQKLKALGQPEAGLLFAAFVAQASGGIDKKESALLHAIGKSAGVPKAKVTALLKRVGASATE